jgi:S1-C subfamily serine protease
MNDAQAICEARADAGTAISSADLEKQLIENTCKLDLAEPRTKPMSTAQIYESRLQSVLLVASLYKCTKCNNWHFTTASGVMISDDGTFVSNYHVFSMKEKREGYSFVMTVDGAIYNVKEILASSKTADLAIARLDNEQGKRFDYAPVANEVATGTPVSVIGHPLMRLYSLTTGVISRHFSQDENEFSRRINITADYALGSSGGPVFDDCGNIAGIVSATQSPKTKVQQMVFKICIPSTSIRKLAGE